MPKAAGLCVPSNSPPPASAGKLLDFGRMEKDKNWSQLVKPEDNHLVLAAGEKVKVCCAMEPEEGPEEGTCLDKLSEEGSVGRESQISTEVEDEGEEPQQARPCSPVQSNGPTFGSVVDASTFSFSLPTDFDIFNLVYGKDKETNGMDNWSDDDDDWYICELCKRQFANAKRYDNHLDRHSYCRCCDRFLELREIPQSWIERKIQEEEDEICEGCREMERRKFALARGATETVVRMEDTDSEEEDGEMWDSGEELEEEEECDEEMEEEEICEEEEDLEGEEYYDDDEEMEEEEDLEGEEEDLEDEEMEEEDLEDGEMEEEDLEDGEMEEEEDDESVEEVDLCSSSRSGDEENDKENQSVDKKPEKISSSSQFQKFYCSECNKQFFNESTYKQHLASGHKKSSTRGYFCKICSKSFHCQSVLNFHVKMHQKEENLSKPFKCNSCGERFQLESFLKHHYMTKHSSSKKDYGCRGCGKLFASHHAAQLHEMNSAQCRQLIAKMKIKSTNNTVIRQRNKK